MSWAQGNEEPHKAAVRTSIGALKRCNGRGAKGRRKMERRGKHMSEQNLSAVTPTKEPKQDKEALRARGKWVERARVDRSNAKDPGNRDQRRNASLTRPGCST